MIQIETRRDRQQQRVLTAKAAAPLKALGNKSHDRRFSIWALYVVLLTFLTVIGTLFQEVAYGQVAIILYGIIAIILRRDSSEMFKMALISLVCIMALTLIGNDAMAKAFAVYAFLFLAFGAMRECMDFMSDSKRKEGP